MIFCDIFKNICDILWYFAIFLKISVIFYDIFQNIGDILWYFVIFCDIFDERSGVIELTTVFTTKASFWDVTTRCCFASDVHKTVAIPTVTDHHIHNQYHICILINIKHKIHNQHLHMHHQWCIHLQYIQTINNDNNHDNESLPP